MRCASCEVVCRDYFKGFEEADCRRNSPKVNALAALKIASYFTVIIPLIFAIALGISQLCGRVKKGPVSGGHLPGFPPQGPQVPASKQVMLSGANYDADFIINFIFGHEGAFVLPDQTRLSNEDIRTLLQMREAASILWAYRDKLGNDEATIDEIIAYWNLQQALAAPQPLAQAVPPAAPGPQPQAPAVIQPQPPAATASLKIVLRGVEIRNEETLIAYADVKTIPDAYLFISSERYAYDIRELDEWYAPQADAQGKELEKAFQDEHAQRDFSDADLRGLNRLSKLHPELKNLRRELDKKGMR